MPGHILLRLKHDARPVQPAAERPEVSISHRLGLRKHTSLNSRLNRDTLVRFGTSDSLTDIQWPCGEILLSHMPRKVTNVSHLK